jgi:hypothetical protein
MGLKEVYDSAMAGYDSAMVDAEADFRRATLNNDVEEQARASMEMASLRVQRNEYHAMAAQHAQSLRVQQQRSPLSDDERDIAHSHPDPKMSNEAKEALYLHNKQRYQHARATGAYRDDQGTVRR